MAAHTLDRAYKVITFSWYSIPDNNASVPTDTWAECTKQHQNTLSRQTAQSEIVLTCFAKMADIQASFSPDHVIHSYRKLYSISPLLEYCKRNAFVLSTHSFIQ